MKTSVIAAAVSSRCPGCDRGISIQRDVKPFKRGYLCAPHQALYDQAWASEIAKEREVRT